MEYKERIKNLKAQLKENGFTRKGIFFAKVEGDKIYSIEFYRRYDGFYNITLGIQFDTDINLVSAKRTDIGWLFRTSSENYFEEIMQWFEARNSIEKIKTLFWSGRLGDFASDRCVRMIKGNDDE